MTKVTNLKVHNQSIVNDELIITFQFDDHEDTSIGGYWLYIAYDTPLIFNKASFKIDSELEKDANLSTTKSDGKIYFEYTAKSEEFGRTLHCYIATVTKSWNVSTNNDKIVVNTIPNSPQNIIAYFNNYEVTIDWDMPETDSSYPDAGMNSKVSSYSVFRNSLIPILDFTIDADNPFLIKHTFLYYNTYFVVYDFFKKIIKTGFITVDGEIDLTDSNFNTNVNDNSYDYLPIKDSMSLFILSDTQDDLVIHTQDYTAIDREFDDNHAYVYRVYANGYDSYRSVAANYFVLTKKLAEVVPYVRNPINSSNILLSNKYWQIFKERLIDSNYYNKEQFAVPYLNNEFHNFKGYLGVYNCEVDVFVNGILTKTVLSDKYGNYEFSIKLAKQKSYIQIQARDYKNIDFSNNSNRYYVEPIYIYTLFSALGLEYADIWEEAENQKGDVSFIEGRYESIINKISPLLDIYKDVTENDTDFRSLLVEIYGAYNYSGYKYALTKLLDAFVNYVDNIGSYKVFYNNEFYDTAVLDSYVLTTGSALLINQLERKKYWYAVTSVNEDGEETDSTQILCDSRWFPVQNEALNYGGDNYIYNILKWDVQNGMNYYNIYRYTGDEPSSINNYNYLTTINGNLFVDTGAISEDDSKNPPPYNITEYTKPTNLKISYNLMFSNRQMKLKKRNWITIFVFLDDNNTLPQVQIDRLIKYTKDLIPIELGFDLYLVNDSSHTNIIHELPDYIKIYNTEGTLDNGIYINQYGTYNNITDPTEFGFSTYGDAYYDSVLYGAVGFYYSNLYNTNNGKSKFRFWTSSNQVVLEYREHAHFKVTDWVTIENQTNFFELEVEQYKNVQFRVVFNTSTWSRQHFALLIGIDYI